MLLNQTEIFKVIQKAEITLCPICSVRYAKLPNQKTNCYFVCPQLHLMCMPCWQQYKVALRTPKAQIKGKDNKIQIVPACPQCQYPIVQIRHFRHMITMLDTQDKINQKSIKLNSINKKQIEDLRLNQQQDKLKDKNKIIQQRFKELSEKYDELSSKNKQLQKHTTKEQKKYQKVRKQKQGLQQLIIQLKVKTQNQDQIKKIKQIYKIQLKSQTDKILNLQEIIQKQKQSLDKLEIQNHKFVQNNIRRKNSECQKHRIQILSKENTINSFKKQLDKLKLQKQIQVDQQYRKLNQKNIFLTYQLNYAKNQLKQLKKKYNQALQNLPFQQLQQLELKQNNSKQKIESKLQYSPRTSEEDLPIFQRLARKMSSQNSEQKRQSGNYGSRISEATSQQKMSKKKYWNQFLVHSFFGELLDLKKIGITSEKADQIVSMKWPNNVNSLDLRQNQLSNQVFAKLAKINIRNSNDLNVLKLSANKISSLTSLSLFRHQNIEHLYLNDNLLSIDAADELTRMKWDKLKSLTISFVEPNGYDCCCKIFQRMQNFPALQTLQIIHSQNYREKLKQKYLTLKQKFTIPKISFFANNDQSLQDLYS